jgi:hypothetical protein
MVGLSAGSLAYQRCLIGQAKPGMELRTVAAADEAHGCCCPRLHPARSCFQRNRSITVHCCAVFYPLHSSRAGVVRLERRSTVRLVLRVPARDKPRFFSAPDTGRMAIVRTIGAANVFPRVPGSCPVLLSGVTTYTSLRKCEGYRDVVIDRSAARYPAGKCCEAPPFRSDPSECVTL